MRRQFFWTRMISKFNYFTNYLRMPICKSDDGQTNARAKPLAISKRLFKRLIF